MDQQLETLKLSPCELGQVLLDKLGKFGAQCFISQAESYMWRHVVPAHFDSTDLGIGQRMLHCVDAQAYLNKVRAFIDASD